MLRQQYLWGGVPQSVQFFGYRLHPSATFEAHVPPMGSLNTHELAPSDMRKYPTLTAPKTILQTMNSRPMDYVGNQNATYVEGFGSRPPSMFNRGELQSSNRKKYPTIRPYSSRKAQAQMAAAQPGASDFTTAKPAFTPLDIALTMYNSALNPASKQYYKQIYDALVQFQIVRSIRELTDEEATTEARLSNQLTAAVSDPGKLASNLPPAPADQPILGETPIQPSDVIPKETYDKLRSVGLLGTDGKPDLDQARVIKRLDEAFEANPTADTLLSFAKDIDVYGQYTDDEGFKKLVESGDAGRTLTELYALNRYIQALDDRNDNLMKYTIGDQDRDNELQAINDNIDETSEFIRRILAGDTSARSDIRDIVRKADQLQLANEADINEHVKNTQKTKDEIMKDAELQMDLARSEIAALKGDKASIRDEMANTKNKKTMTKLRKRAKGIDNKILSQQTKISKIKRSAKQSVKNVDLTKPSIVRRPMTSGPKPSGLKPSGPKQSGLKPRKPMTSGPTSGPTIVAPDFTKLTFNELVSEYKELADALSRDDRQLENLRFELYSKEMSSADRSKKNTMIDKISKHAMELGGILNILQSEIDRRNAPQPVEEEKEGGIDLGDPVDIVQHTEVQRWLDDAIGRGVGSSRKRLTIGQFKDLIVKLGIPPEPTGSKRRQVYADHIAKYRMPNWFLEFVKDPNSPGVSRIDFGKSDLSASPVKIVFTQPKK